MEALIEYTFFELSASFMNSHSLHIDHVARQWCFMCNLSLIEITAELMCSILYPDNFLALADKITEI